MPQYPIPQFIESEGKMIYFLTFRQFFILVGGGALCILLYYILPFFLFAILGVIIALLVAGIAFVKIDNASLVTIFLNFISFSMGTKSYTWKKKEVAYPFKAKPPAEPEIKDVKPLPPMHMQKSKLKAVQQMVETKK